MRKMGKFWLTLLAASLTLTACGDNTPKSAAVATVGSDAAAATQLASPEGTVKPATANLPPPPNLNQRRPAPEFDNTSWLNSPKVTLEDLRGKVVLVEFWTFGCYNCRNVQPALKGWYDAYKSAGLEIVAFHAPEFDYEKKLDNLQKAVAEQGLKYPVAVDNDFKTWGKYRVNAWPTMFLVDKQGQIRYTHIGEGRYGEIEAGIVALLNERS